MKIFTQIHDFCVRVTSSKIFKNTIVLIILINSIVLGLITSEAIYAKFGELLEFILSACVVIFTVEITLRIIAKGWRFFLNGWNIFDFLLITMALMPETGAAITFRVFRVLRALRMVSSMKKLRHIVSAIFSELWGKTSSTRHFLNGLALLERQSTLCFKSPHLKVGQWV